MNFLCHVVLKDQGRQPGDAHLERRVPRATRDFPAVVLTGPEVFAYVCAHIEQWLLPGGRIRRCFGQFFRKIGQVHPAAEGRQLLSPALLPA